MTSSTCSGSADVFLPNAAEARRIAGVDDVEAAALALARTGAAGRSDGGPTIVGEAGGRRRARGQGGWHRRARPGDAGRPGRHDRCRRFLRRRVPARLAGRRRRSATASSSASSAAPCRPARPAAWTPSRRSPRRRRRAGEPGGLMAGTPASAAVRRGEPVDRPPVRGRPAHRRRHPAAGLDDGGPRRQGPQRRPCRRGARRRRDRGRDRRRAVGRLDRGPARRARAWTCGRSGSPRRDADLRLDPRPRRPAP